MKKESWENLKYLPSDWALVRVASLPQKLLIQADLKNLQALLAVPQFKEILRTSSPEFYQRFVDNEFKGTKQDLLNAFIKYLMRSSLNPIPRKIFAGYNIVQFKRQTDFKIQDLNDWECKLVDSSSKKTNKYFFNSFIYFKKDELRYKIFDSEKRSWQDCTFRLNKADLKIYKELIAGELNSFTKLAFFKKNKKFKSQLENIWLFFVDNQIIYRHFKKDFTVEKNIKFSQLAEIKNIEEHHEWELHPKFDSEPSLPEKFGQKISSATTTLIRLFQFEHRAHFQSSTFGKYFIDKMQDPDVNEIPLLQALDAQSIDFYQRNADELKKMSCQSDVAEDIKYKISTAIGSGQKNVTFSKDEIETLLQKSTKQLETDAGLNFYPQSVSVFCGIGPDFTPVLKRINGGSFYSTFGKYAYYNDSVDQRCVDFFKNHIQDEEANEFIYAIVSCDTKVVQINSVLSASHDNFYRICINRPCESEKDIPLSDIFLKTTPMGLFIRSHRLKKQIKILNSSMIGDGIVENAAFDFLKQLGQFDSFNNIDPLPLNLIRHGYVPRITFPSAIVHLETWRIFKSKQKKMQSLSNQDLQMEFDKLGVPTQFHLIDSTSGSRLLIDLSKPELVDFLRTFMTGAVDLDLEEILVEQVTTHACDFIVPLFRSPRQSEHAMYSPLELSQPADSTFAGPAFLQIEEGVISYEIYLEKTKDNDFVGLHFRQALLQIKKKYPSSNYFFIRYWDPKDGFHIRLRFLNPNPNLLIKFNSDFIRILQKWKVQEWIAFYKCVPFRPEYHRYSGELGVQIYIQDSVFQSNLILSYLPRFQNSNFEERFNFSYEVTKMYLDGLNLSNPDLQNLILNQLNKNGHKNSEYDIQDSKTAVLKPADFKLLKKHLADLFKSLRHLPGLELERFVLSLLHLLNNRLGLPLRFDSVILRRILKDLRRSASAHTE